MARELEEGTTAAEVWAWHAADRPDCGCRWLTMKRDGYGCPRCGWVVLDPTDADT